MIFLPTICDRSLNFLPTISNYMSVYRNCRQKKVVGTSNLSAHWKCISPLYFTNAAFPGVILACFRINVCKLHSKNIRQGFGVTVKCEPHGIRRMLCAVLFTPYIHMPYSVWFAFLGFAQICDQLWWKSLQVKVIIRRSSTRH